MKTWKIVAAILMFSFLLWLSFQEVWTEPYFHKSKVNFWSWLQRELWEVRHGEAE